VPPCRRVSNEGGQFLPVRRLEPFPEVSIRRLRRPAGTGLDQADRAAVVQADHDAVAGSEDLEAHVAAKWIAARPGEDHEAAA
jgi:hypothetical protein